MRVGIDVVDISRFKDLLDRVPEIQDRLFTRTELAYCATKKDPRLHLAGTLAAKEAVMKTLEVSPLVVWASRIEVSRDPSGAPRIAIHGKPSSTRVSISHDGLVAAAIAVSSGLYERDRLSELGPWLDRVGEVNTLSVPGL